uniref:3-isopropylmalate dehydrogenase n=2 Tax=Bacteria TaxID=2 RepID=A0A7C9JPP9_9BACT
MTREAHMKSYKICLLPGDGIGPEIIAEGCKVLDAVGRKYGVSFDYTEALLGGCAIDATGSAFPDETLAAAQAADAVLLAAVGGPKWDTTDPEKPRPEQGLLGIRKALGLYTNLRPVQIFNALAGASTLKPAIIDGVDLMIVRELIGGAYFGERKRFYDEPGSGVNGAPGQRAYDTMEYREYEIDRIARQAFEAARKRRNKVTSVDKANVLESSRLWREVVHRVHDADYPDVQLEDILVDNMAMQLINRPADFDVVVTENLFGDILSDEAAQITGSLGMLASASLGDGTALYEPSHGSAPDIAGKGIANPLAQILSVEMMLRYSFGMTEAADDVKRAVAEVLDEGWRTGDIKAPDTPADKVVGTVMMGDLVVERIQPSGKPEQIGGRHPEDWDVTRAN